MNYGLLQPVVSISSSSVKPFFDFVHTGTLTPESLSRRGVALITQSDDIGLEIRQYLNTFRNHFNNISIYDLGTLLSKEPQSFTEVIQMLKQHSILPFIIGVSSKLATEICKELNTSCHHITNMPVVDTKNPAYLFNNFIGYQRHLISIEEMQMIESHSTHALSLGKMRTFPTLLEPVLRDCQLLRLNVNVMKSSEVGQIDGTLPTGLTSEELCQIMQHAGNAFEPQAVIAEWHDSPLAREKSSALFAEAFWYFCEGFNMNTGDHPSKSGDFSEFIVYSQQMDEQLDFIRHNPTMKWWLRKTAVDGISQYLSCSFEEYQSVVANEVPDRLFRFQHD